MNTALIVMIVYLVVVTVVGSLVARRSTGSRDWAVAGGGMGLLMVAVGVAGTRIGGAGTYGVAGNVMGYGVWYGWWYGINTFLALAIVGLFFAVPYRRLQLQTVGEIFTVRFGSRRSQALTSLCVQTEYAIVNVIEAYVIGVMLVGLTGMSMVWGVTIAAIVLITYTALGGLWGTAYTNLIHCTVILLGLFAVGALGLEQAGGWESMRAQVDQHIEASDRKTSDWWAFAGAGWGAVLGMFFSASVHTPAASVYTNYSTAARTEKQLLPAFLLAGSIACLMPFLAGFIGILTFAKYGETPIGSGYVLLTKLATDISPIVGGIALAAVLAAVISSGGPILLSSATMFVRDWLPFTRRYDPAKKLFAYRLTTVVYGILAAIVAYYVRQQNVSVLDMLLFGFAMVVPPAIAVAYLLYWRRTTEVGAFWGMVTGYAAGLAWFLAIQYALAIGLDAPPDAPFLQRLAHYFFVHRGEGVDPSYATTIVPLIVVPLVSMFTKDQTEGKDKFYAVTSGALPPDVLDE